MNEALREQLANITDPDNIRLNEDMSAHTTFRVGGCADVFVTPAGLKEATEIVRLLLTQDHPFTVIGNGSNLIVTDSGYRGCIVCLGHGCDNIEVCGNSIKAGAGAMLAKIAKTAFDNSLTGLEFASGIPGSVGGAVVMNAGAYGGEIKDVVKKVTLFDTVTNETVELSADEMKFGYRRSIVKDHPYIVLEAEFEMTPGDSGTIKETMDDLANRRRDKQPLEYPSAGSTFKRPEGYFAAKLIEDAGLKGESYGGAKVSDKHSGFVINTGGASATDVLKLISRIQKKVYEDFNVKLETEVVILGDIPKEVVLL